MNHPFTPSSSIVARGQHGAKLLDWPWTSNGALTTVEYGATIVQPFAGLCKFKVPGPYPKQTIPVVTGQESQTKALSQDRGAVTSGHHLLHEAAHVPSTKHRRADYV
jgi:hypothetical protein